MQPSSDNVQQRQATSRCSRLSHRPIQDNAVAQTAPGWGHPVPAWYHLRTLIITWLIICLDEAKKITQHRIQWALQSFIVRTLLFFISLVKGILLWIIHKKNNSSWFLYCILSKLTICSAHIFSSLDKHNRNTVCVCIFMDTLICSINHCLSGRTWFTAASLVIIIGLCRYSLCVSEYKQQTNTCTDSRQPLKLVLLRFHHSAASLAELCIFSVSESQQVLVKPAVLISPLKTAGRGFLIRCLWILVQSGSGGFRRIPQREQEPQSVSCPDTERERERHIRVAITSY